MNMPGFTAEASLDKLSSRRRYRQEAFSEQRGELQGTILIPQLQRSGGPGRQDCLDNCIEKNPTWTVERCARSCNDPGGSGGSSPSVPGGPSTTACAFDSLSCGFELNRCTADSSVWELPGCYVEFYNCIGKSC